MHCKKYFCPNKSLTFKNWYRFDELVNRARQQDKIEKILATKKAKSFVSMLVQRRRFLKEREERHDTQILDLGLLIEEPELQKYLDVERPLLNVSQDEHVEEKERKKSSGSPGKNGKILGRIDETSN